MSARDTSHCAVISASPAVSYTVLSTSHYTVLSVSYTTDHTAMSSSHTTHYSITPANSNIYETATEIICHTIVSPTFIHHAVSSLYQTAAVNHSMPDTKFSGHATPTPLCTNLIVAYTPRANISTTITTVFSSPSDTCISITNTCEPKKITITITATPFINFPCICSKLRNISNHIYHPVTCCSNGNASITFTSIIVDYSNTHVPTANTAVPYIHLSVAYSNLPETKFNLPDKYNAITVPWCTCP